IGMLEAFEKDIEVALRYGVDQCVGDTLAAGGIMYGQRGIPQILDFCRDIREAAAPGCILLSYSNPCAMMTWACIKYGGVRTLGLCHGEIHGEMQIAEVLGLKDRKELDVICAGLNHQTWYLSVKHNGQEMTGRLLEAFEKHPVYSQTEKVRIDVLRRFGCYSTESNGHLSEYVAWYRKRPGEIERWIDLSSWINGETGGYLRETRENRDWFETEFPKLLQEPPKRYDGSARSSEHGSYIIEALETGRTYRGHFNVMNHGAISNLPDDCVVEVPCYVDGNGISVPRVGELPMGCAAVCSQSAWVQRMAVEAAVSGNAELLKQAALMDPLTGAVCNPPEVWQMVDEMLIAQEKWLPQYGEAIAAAKARFAKGGLIPTNAGYRGAVRQRVKTAEEVAAERREREERHKRE
ncbi:MAG: alpha-glucosidase/alpha-galactosidase, partial [Clostridia bacterium]|nr:alpha-glucosidase/alpha-galactosidase [Clostridia bacterium]